MINFTLEHDWGAIDFFVLPYFRERTHPDERARLRGAFPLLKNAVYDSGAGRWHTDVAVRWSYFTGSPGSRRVGLPWNQPGAALGTGDDRGRTRGAAGVPDHRSSLDRCAVDRRGDLMEALTRGGHGDRFLAAVAGVEYTVFGIGPDPPISDCWLNSCSTDATKPAPFTRSTTRCSSGRAGRSTTRPTRRILGGPVIDYDTGEVFAFLEAERRFSDRWIRRARDEVVHEHRRDRTRPRPETGRLHFAEAQPLLLTLTRILGPARSRCRRHGKIQKRIAATTGRPGRGNVRRRVAFRSPLTPRRRAFGCTTWTRARVRPFWPFTAN